MPQFVVTSPEGKKFRVNAPEGATQQDAINYIMSNQLQQLPQQVQPATSQGGIGRQIGLAARYGAEGLAALPAVGANVVAGLSNELLGTEFPEQAGAVSRALTEIGLPEPQTPTERVVGDVSRALAGTGGVVKGADLLSKGVAPVTQGILQMLSQAPKVQAASTIGGAAGAGMAKEVGANPLVQTIAGLAGGAAPVLAGNLANNITRGSKTLVQGATARTPEQLQVQAEDLKSAAGGLRGEMQKLGVVVKREGVNKLSKSLDKNLSKVKLIPELSPKTIAIVDTIKEEAKKGSLELDSLDQYRRLLRVAKDEDAVAAQAVRKAIDDTVNSLQSQDLSKGGTQAVGLLNQFRKDWQKASKFEDITDILVKADQDPNKIKSGLTRYLNSNPPGWSVTEKLALKEAARASTPEKLMKMLGKFGIDLGSSTAPGNTVAPLIGSLGGAAAGGLGAGAAVPIFGTLARQGQKYMARGKAENLLQAILQGNQ